MFSWWLYASDIRICLSTVSMTGNTLSYACMSASLYMGIFMQCYLFSFLLSFVYKLCQNKHILIYTHTHEYIQCTYIYTYIHMKLGNEQIRVIWEYNVSKIKKVCGFYYAMFIKKIFEKYKAMYSIANSIVSCPNKSFMCIVKGFNECVNICTFMLVRVLLYNVFSCWIKPLFK